MKLNKAAGALLAVALCSASTLFGAEDAMMSVKPNGCKGPVLCPTFSILDEKGPCCHTWHVGVGLLYQQPGFSGMNSGTAYQGVFDATTSSTTFVNQTIRSLQENFDYALGLTASLGHLLPHDDWVAMVKFDWLSATTSKIHGETNDRYAPNLNFNYDVMAKTSWDVDSDYFTVIKYKADVNIYALDVFLSRGSFLSRCSSFEPFMGVKALWYNANQLSKYFAVLSAGNVLTNGNVPSLNQAQNNWGAGPMFGFNGEYHITHGFSLFSDSDIAILYGASTNVFTSSLSASPSSTPAIAEAQTIPNSLGASPQFYLPVRSIIGVKFSKYCLNDAHFIAAKLGYDARIVLTNSSLLSEVSRNDTGLTHGTVVTTVSNDLIMSGLYVNFEWNF